MPAQRADLVQDLRAFKLPRGFRGRSPIIVQLWWIVDALFFQTSPQFMYSWRRSLLRAFGATIGRGVLIRPSARITYPWKVSIGDYSWIGDESVLYSLGQITIGANVSISHRVYLCTGSHDYRTPSFPIYASPIVIHDEAWLANDVFVGPGVQVGRGCVVAARSSAFSDLPAMMVCAGTPAIPKKPRVSSLPEERFGEHPSNS